VIQKLGEPNAAYRVVIRPDDPLWPKLSPEAIARLEALDRLDMKALAEMAKWPLGRSFNFHDEAGEHDPCYVGMPDGAMLSVAHCADVETDIARALFIVRACNASLKDAQP
jgi:hypothetical protein